MASMKPRRFIFFPSFQPVFNSTSNLDTTRISSCYGFRYQAVNLVDLLIHSSNIIDSTHSCRNSSNHLDTKHISSCYGFRYQAVNLVDLLIHSSNVIDSTHSCHNFSIYLDMKGISSKFILHNLFYVLLFVVSFTDCIFDAYNRWNHCIFKILCVRHWYIFPCTATDWCIQVVKCFRF